MAYEFIEERDFDCSPASYAEYLRATEASARRTLEQPEAKWPRGSSHEISRQILDECQDAYAGLALDFGLFDLHGRLVGFIDPDDPNDRDPV